MLLYKTSRSGVAATPRLGDAAAGVLDRAAAREGHPFILSPDGSYDLQLNRFLRELEGWGVRSAHSVEAYARDLTLFCRFLHQRRGGKLIWEAGPDDLFAYRRARREVEGFRVAASTWNRFIAAVDKWAQWAVHEGLLETAPFRYVERTVPTPRGPAAVRVNTAREVDEESLPVQFLPYVDYLLWRDVGLRGQLPDGRPDPRWRGRNGERNAVFADLLVGTGMRLTEAASLLVTEVPPLVERRLVGDLHLPATITKRGRARTVFVSRRTLRALHAYLDVERDELVQRRLAAGAYADAGDALVVGGASRHGLTLAGESRCRPYSRITIEERRRLVRADAAGRPGAPLWLWLGEDGHPLRRETWQAAFQRANERCARFGLDLSASPHLLRHVFAVHMLGLLLRQTVRALQGSQRATVTGEQVKRLLVGDPLRKLQLLLGHKHVATTYAYLDVLDEAQEIVLSALADWDEQTEALRRVTAEEAA